MKISLNWLKDYVDFSISAQEISDIMSDLGLPTESIEQVGDDTVIDLEVTSNRGDCLSVIGVARELAAAIGAELKLPQIEIDYLDQDTSRFIDVTISQPQLCNRYTARYIEGVKIGETPQWMRERLEAVGIRSVNNVVDATNYAMMETGQPPHAFDYDKLDGDRIHVRKAMLGERIVSIDSTKCDLSVDMLIIADESKPVAIAGVMGGLNSEVTAQTTRILLEDAHFDPVSVRTTARSLGISSDASFRFERHVDVEMIEWASSRTAQLIQMVAGGKVAQGVVDASPVPYEPKTVIMRLSRLNTLMGYDFNADKVNQIFTALEFEPEYDSAKGQFKCIAPSWRHDINREVDLIEEAARFVGYSQIPARNQITVQLSQKDRRYAVAQNIFESLSACGFYETLSVTFTDDKVAALFSPLEHDKYFGVKDVTRKSANKLRQTLLGSLCTILKNNHNTGSKSCRFYELADTFETVAAGNENHLSEKTKLALLCDGDLRLVRGTIESIVKKLNKVSKVDFVPAQVYWAKVGADVLIDGKKVGVAGILNDKVAQFFDFKDSRPAALEIEFDSLMDIEGKIVKIKHLPKYPSISRDISVIVDESAAWSQIESIVIKNAPQELEGVAFVDIYRGKPIDQGKKSVTFTMTFRDDLGTLTHQQVDQFEATIVEGLKNKLGALLRTA